MSKVEQQIRKAEQSEATRASLLKAGRELCGERGSAATSREDIVERSGLTRGAFHYHFPRKEDLFLAVHEGIEQEVVRKIAATVFSQSSTSVGPWEQLRDGGQAFLDACLDPAVQRITLLDAPSVLGWEKWREIDSKYGFGLLRTGLQAALDAGAIEAQPVEPLAAFILGGLIEAAMLVARADDVDRARREVSESLDRLLNRLRIPAEGEEK